MKLLLLTKFFGIIAGHSFAVYFNERETSPSLIKVKEGEELQLNCSYCVKSSKEDTTLSWYKDGYVISHGIKNHSAVLGVPVVQHNRDEGLYKCVVTYKEQNISKVITVIVNKGGFFRICFLTRIQGGMPRFAHLKNISLKFFKFVACNACQASPSLTILVPLWFIIVSLVFAIL